MTITLEPVHQSIVSALQPYVSEGWLTPERGCEMADLILREKPMVCVEIGVFGGRSLVSQALALKANGKGKIFGIDPWRIEPAIEGESEINRKWWTENMNLHDIHRGAMELVWRLGLDEQVVIVRCQSQHIAQWFPMINVLNIDGNHSEIASCRDVELYVPRVVPGGFVWMDDCDWHVGDHPSTRKAVALINAQCELVKDYGHYRLYQKR